MSEFAYRGYKATQPMEMDKATQLLTEHIKTGRVALALGVDGEAAVLGLMATIVALAPRSDLSVRLHDKIRTRVEELEVELEKRKQSHAAEVVRLRSEIKRLNSDEPVLRLRKEIKRLEEGSRDKWREHQDGSNAMAATIQALSAQVVKLKGPKQHAIFCYCADITEEDFDSPCGTLNGQQEDCSRCRGELGDQELCDVHLYPEYYDDE